MARAGRTGRAISILSPEEMPYFMDLYMFLTRPVHFALTGEQVPEGLSKLDKRFENRGEYSSSFFFQGTSDVLGSIPQTAVDTENEKLSGWHCGNVDIVISIHKRTSISL